MTIIENKSCGWVATEAQFDLGEIGITQAVVGAMTFYEIFVALLRHSAGDWGEVSEEICQENGQSLKNGFRLFSKYQSETGKEFWIITEADRSKTTAFQLDRPQIAHRSREAGRSATTVLLAEQIDHDKEMRLRDRTDTCGVTYTAEFAINPATWEFYWLYQKPIFELGQIVMSPGALECLSRDELNCAVTKHCHGEWGEVHPCSAAFNDEAVANGERIFSVYEGECGKEFCVITEHDRSMTTVRLDEEAPGGEEQGGV